LPEGFDKYDFRELMKEDSNKRNSIRLLAMHHFQQGKSVLLVSEMVQHHYQTVSRWLCRFKKSGLSGLLESPRSGAPRKLNVSDEKWIQEAISKLAKSKTGGYITGKELQDILLEKERVSVQPWHSV